MSKEILFALLGVVGIIATVLIGLSSFEINLAPPFILIGVLLSVIIIGIGCILDAMEKR